MRHRSTLLLGLLFSGVAVALAGCNPGEPLEVRTAPDTDSVEVDPGGAHEISRTDRGAMMVIFDGRLDEEGNFGVEVDEVYDADVHVGPSNEAGDPHWVTRARILDEDGETLWTQRINSHYQLLQFMSPVIEEFNPTGFEFSVDFLYDVAREDYPELLKFPAKIPNEIEGADRYVLEVQNDGRDWERAASFSIDELEERAVEPDPDFDYEINSLVENGPDDDSINIAIVGDGYTEDERDVFQGDAQAVADRFMDESPMSEHGDLFNIRTVWAPSEESGAGYDCNHSGAPEGCEQDFRDTPFETTFVVPALGEEYGFPTEDVSDRVAMPLDIAAVYEVAALASYDEVILISNSEKFSGFAGLYVALVTNFDDRDYFPDTAVHEVGHTLGLLGDEYFNSSDACYYNEPTIPLPVNIDNAENGRVKWSEWIEKEDVPIPTPSFLENTYDFGAFKPAYNCDFLVRPAQTCKMNSSSDEFCRVCAEKMVRRFYSVVDPAGDGPATVSPGTDAAILEVPIRSEGRDRYDVIWTVDGEPMPTRGPVLEVPYDELDGQWATVTASIRNTTDFIKTVDHVVETDFQFEIRAANSGG